MSSSDAGPAASSPQQSQSPDAGVVIRMPSAATEARDGVTDPFAAMRIMAASSGSTAAQVSSSASSADGALHRSLQALSDTLAHTKAQQKQQEDIMAAKLRAKGKRIATSAKFAAEPTGPAQAPAGDQAHVAQSAGDSGAPAVSVQSQNDSTQSPVARPARANKPRRAVRFADVDEGDESGEETAASASASTSGCTVAAAALPVSAVAAPANPSAASDFDAFLAAQWGSAIGAIQSRTAATATAGEATSTTAPSDSAAFSDAGGTPASSSVSLPAFVSVDPVSLCSFLHFRAPLSKPRIPMLAELCCSALATLAQDHELDPEAMGIDALPTHVLEACIAGTKRPRTRSRPLKPAPSPADQRPAQDSAMAAPSRPGLRDSHLLPFLHPQLDRLSLDADGADSAGGGLQGLAEVLAAEISPRLLDVVAARCLSLQHLNLTGYSHAFSPAQILALARLPLLSLSLAHCRVAAPELRLMLAHCDGLRCLNIGWTSCVLAEFGSGSFFGGDGSAAGGGGGECGALDDILCVLSRPELRASLRRLNVDGARADPNGLLSALLGLLPRLEALEMDSVSPSSSSSSSISRGSDGEGEADEGAEERARAIEQLVADNAALKGIFEQQLKLQRERAAEAMADQSAPEGLRVSSMADGSSPAPTHAGAFRYPHLRSLSTVASALLSEESMLLVASHAPNLTALDLKGCGQVSNAVVALLAANCRGLQKLGLADCQRVDSEAIWALRDAAEPPRTKLGGSGQATKVDGASFSASGAAAPHGQASFPSFLGSCLRAVDFSWCENLSNQSLACLFDMRASTATATQAGAPPLSSGGSAGADSESTWSGPAFDSDWDGCRGGASALSAAEEDDPAPPCPFGLERVVLSCVEDLDESTAAKLAKHARIRELDLSRCLNLSAAAIFGEETAPIEGGVATATAAAAGSGSADAPSSAGSSSSSSSSASLCPSLSSPLPWSQLLRVNLAWTSVRNCDLGLLGSRCPSLQWLGVEGCKQLDDGCVAALMQLQPGSAKSAESAGRSALFNLAFVSFFFVNNVSMRAVVQLIRESRSYWITVRSYYGDIHDPDTIENDEKEL